MDPNLSPELRRLAEALDPLLSLPPIVLWSLALGLAGVLLILALRASRRRAERRFAQLSHALLQQQQTTLLDLASERMRTLQTTAAAEFEGRHQAVEDLVAPLQQALASYQQEARESERIRGDQAGRLGEQLRSLSEQTTSLAGALRAPGARGRWGELSLRRTVELAGLSAHCDFDEQPTLVSGRGGLRPDLVVQLPSGRRVVVDAKAPLDAYLEAHHAPDDAQRSDALGRHAKHVRRHVEALASRDYAAHLEGSPEFVVLFLPHEGFLAAAVEDTPDLVAEALDRGIVLATPATLFALLAAVAQGWREVQLAENTKQVLQLAREMDERLGVFAEHLGKLGGTLGKAVAHFNSAVGSFESRVLTQARRMRELGVQGSRSLDTPRPIEPTPRPLRTAEDATASEARSEASRARGSGEPNADDVRQRGWRTPERG
jgi:DNA recombination protein RmuC